jgi:hypothetical protein
MDGRTDRLTGRQAARQKPGQNTSQTVKKLKMSLPTPTNPIHKTQGDMSQTELKEKKKDRFVGF